MHYVLEVQALFYRDILIQIWLVTEIAAGALQGMSLLLVEQQ